MNEPAEPEIDERRVAKLRKLRRDRIVTLWLIFLPGLACVAVWVISMGTDNRNTGYFGFAIVMALITLPWTAICAGFLTGTWPELKGTGARRLGIGLLIWIVATALNAVVVGTVIVAGCAHNWNQHH